MYRVLPESERLGFGDVISGPWLFDLYLRHDAVALSSQDRSGGRVWLENAAPRAQREPGKDGVLSHSDYALGSGNKRHAIIVTDDCEMESLQKRNASGRILLAAIAPAPVSEIEAAEARGTYRRFPLPPDTSTGFPGGIVELQRLVSVFLPSLMITPHTYERVLSLESGAQGRLSQSLCAHVTRHGPIVAVQESAKLAGLMTADGDANLVREIKEDRLVPNATHTAASEAITRALSAAWILEGRVLDQVSDEWEKGAPAGLSVGAVEDQLVMIRDAADEALKLLKPTS